MSVTILAKSNTRADLRTSVLLAIICMLFSGPPAFGQSLTMPGDLNGDYRVNALDGVIYYGDLFANMAQPNPGPEADRNYVDNFGRFVADVNGDCKFTQEDVDLALEGGTFETGQLSTWETGDWNGDEVFDRSDIELAQASGLFTQQSIPENNWGCIQTGRLCSEESECYSEVGTQPHIVKQSVIITLSTGEVIITSGIVGLSKQGPLPSKFEFIFGWADHDDDIAEFRFQEIYLNTGEVVLDSGFFPFETNATGGIGSYFDHPKPADFPDELGLYELRFTMRDSQGNTSNDAVFHVAYEE